MRVLLANKSNLQAKERHGWTPLHLAVSSAHIEAIQILLQHRTRSDIRDKNWLTPLHLAVQTCELESIRVLLQNGVNVHTKASDDRTALHMASLTGEIAVVRSLLNADATADECALKLAKVGKHAEIVAILDNIVNPSTVTRFSKWLG